MDIVTNLRGRLENTCLPVNSALLSVFECVSNAMHSIVDTETSDGQRSNYFGNRREQTTSIRF